MTGSELLMSTCGLQIKSNILKRKLHIKLIFRQLALFVVIQHGGGTGRVAASKLKGIFSRLFGVEFACSHCGFSSCSPVSCPSPKTCS